LKINGTKHFEISDAYLMVWTTTPWTLLANVALAVGSDIDYVLVTNKRTVKDGTLVEKLILAESRLSVLDGEYEILKKFKGKDLIGTSYEQIFNYCRIDKSEFPEALTVLAGDFVSTEDGSGIVHLAPAFGEDDYAMSKKFTIPFLQPVTPNGHFTGDMGEFAGRAIKNFTYAEHTEEGADKDIIIALKYADKIYRVTNDYLHSYPHCWRTGNPVMYYARESWFIKSPEYKQRMIDLNKTIKWQPEEIGTGRFGHWLEDVKEWSLSRDRFWGTPIPIWVAEDDSDMFAIGSVEELKQGKYEDESGNLISIEESGHEIDLHRPFVDHIVFEKNGKIYRRIPEVVDVWFDSGAMPFAQFHYPFENQEIFEKSFPGDFIAEGIDQTRGWFYTLHNIAVALFDKPAFKNIVVNELILDKFGVKMSKSKGNVIDPFIVMDKFGADAVRWYLYVNNPPWKATLFSEEDISKTIISDFFRSLTNIYAFFALYANIDNYDGTEEYIPMNERMEIDRWIISRTNSLIDDFRKQMDDYELTKAHRAVQSFVIYELSNWYIRRNRRRFWKGDKDNEKIAAYQTLRDVLIAVFALMAPTAPFLAENLYLRIRKFDDPESIHLMDFPQVNNQYIDKDLESKMWLAQHIVSLARSLREKAKIRVRQPLNRILIPVLNPQQRRNIQYFEEIIKEELNIKNIEYVSGDTDIVSKKAKADFKVIGKKFGKITQLVANTIKEFTNAQIKELETKKQIVIMAADIEIEINIEDVEIVSDNIEGWLVASEEGVTIALDTNIDADLLNEGMAREFVSKIQNLRKSHDYEVTDRINIKFSASNEFADGILKLIDYVSGETLADTILLENSLEGEDIEIENQIIRIRIEKV
jgi:isoleucyl-tRNA synthetase